MSDSHNAFDYGVAMALQIHGLSRQEFVKMAACHDRLDESSSEPYGRMCAEIGREIYQKAGRTDTTGYHLFDNLVKRATWCPQAQKLAVGIVHTALGDMRVKSASSLMEVAASAAGGAVKNSPAMLKYLYMLSALTGVGAGAVAWSTERDAKQDNEEVESQKARADAYNQMSYMLDNGIK